MRKYYADIAGRIAQALVATEPNGDAQDGVISTAIAISLEVEKQGRMGQTTFLKLCGITPGKKRGRRLEIDPLPAYLSWVHGEGDHGGDDVASGEATT